MATKKSHRKQGARKPTPSAAPSGLGDLGPRRGRVAGALIAASGLSSVAALPVRFGTNVGRSVALLIVAALWLAFWASRGLPRLSPRTRMLAIAVASCAAAAVLSAVVSPYRGAALTWGGIGYFGAPAWLSLLVILASASRVRLAPSDRIWIAAAIAWVPVSAVIGIGERLANTPVSGIFNTSNPFAAMMVLAAPVALWGGHVGHSTAEKTLWRTTAALAVTAVLAAGSAAGILGLAIEVLALLVFAPALLGLADSRRAARVAKAYATVLAFAGLALVAVLVIPEGSMPSAIAKLESGVFGTTFETRVEMWRMALRTWGSHPILGVGPDGFQLAAQPHLTSRLLSLEPVAGLATVPPDPHSAPLLILVSFGLVGSAVAALLGVSWARVALFEPAHDDATDAFLLRRASAAGTVGFFAALLFMPWAIITGGACALLAGIAVSGPRSDEHGDRITRAGREPVARAGMGVAGCALFVLAAMQLTGSIRIDAALDSRDANRAADIFWSASRAMPTSSFPRFMALDAEARFLGPGEAELNAWRQRVDEQRKIMRDNAVYLALLARTGLDQAYRFGRTDVSWERGLIEEAANLAPAAPDVLLEQVHLALIEGDETAAAELLEESTNYRNTTSRFDLYAYYLARAVDDTATAAALAPVLAPEYDSQALLEPLQ